VTLSTHAVGRFAERCSRDIEYHDRVRELRHLWEHAVIVEDRPTWIGRLVGPASDEAAAESPALYALIADIVFPLILNDDDRGWVATTCLMKLGARGNHRASANYQRRPARAQKASRRKYRERGPELGRRGMRWALDDE
jgi:hypothetical protein